MTNSQQKKDEYEGGALKTMFEWNDRIKINEEKEKKTNKKKQKIFAARSQSVVVGKKHESRALVSHWMTSLVTLVATEQSE